MKLKKWELSGLLTTARAVGEVGMKVNGSMMDIWVRIDGKPRWFAIDKNKLMDFIYSMENLGETIFRAESDGNGE